MTQADCLAATPRSKLRRRPERGRRERGVVENILDEALVCHVGFIDGGVPVVIPTTPWRVDRWLYLHGAANSRLIRHVASGATVCVSVALVDGLVFARSAMRHSTDYRSVVLFGQGESVGNPADKTRALLRLIDKLSPGRAKMVRPPDDNELAATGVVRLPITEGSAKIRAAPPDADRAGSRLAGMGWHGASCLTCGNTGAGGRGHWTYGPGDSVLVETEMNRDHGDGDARLFRQAREDAQCRLSGGLNGSRNGA